MALNYMRIGRRVQEIRKMRKLSQADLAELADISVPYIRHIETALKKPSLESVVKIADALGVTVEPLSAQAANVRATATMQAAAIYFFMLNIPFTILFYGFIIYKKHISVK